MNFHPFSNVPADECMCCGQKFLKAGQSEQDAEVCVECYDDMVDFVDDEDDLEPTVEDVLEYMGYYERG